MAVDAQELVRWLEELGICAVPVPSGMGTARIASSLAADRILLTTDTAGFRHLAIAHKIGLVVIPPDLLGIPFRAASRVSSEMQTSRLWSRRRPWLQGRSAPEESALVSQRIRSLNTLVPWLKGFEALERAVPIAA